MSFKSKTKGVAYTAAKLAAAASNPVLGVGIAAHETYKGVKNYKAVAKEESDKKELRNMGYDAPKKSFAKTKAVLGAGLFGAAGIAEASDLFKGD